MTDRITLVAPCAGWLSPLGDVPDPVFAAGLAGDGLAIDPLEATLHAPGDGTVVAVHPARHAVTLRLDCGAELLLHAGLETVALGGDGFTAHAAAGQRVTAGAPLLTLDLAAVAPRAKSLMSPVILAEPAGHAIAWRAPAGRIARGEPLLVLAPIGPVAATGGDFTPTIRREVRLTLAHGLHARPCARLAELARGFDADLRIGHGGATARLRSPSAVMALGAGHGAALTLLGAGAQAEPAVDALAALLASGMGEGAPLTPRPAPPAPPEPRHAEPTTPLPGERLAGVSAAPGFAIGPAFRLTRPEPPAPQPLGDPAAELALFDSARAGLDAALAASAAGPGASAAIAAAHRALLADEEILGETRAAIAAGQGAAAAWAGATDRCAAMLRAAPDPRIAQRADDIADLAWQLRWHLAGLTPPSPAAAIPDGAILLADDFVPSEVAALDPERIGGIATAGGGPTSHVAIIAASRGIPALVAAGPRLLAIAPGTGLVLDADHGVIEIAPDTARLEAAAAAAGRRRARKEAARAAAAHEGRTRDGHRIEVFANLGQVAEAAPALAQGAEGCGLLRSEFLFLDRAEPPGEDEQVEAYAAISRALDGRPLIVRLLDIGGDKPAPYVPFPREDNPALGQRGIRLGLARPDLLAPQLRAVLRAAQAGDLRLMAPMIARVEELRALRAALARERAALPPEMSAPVPLGIMVETPAAAIMADVLAAECDFLSIGTNDLAQYALAMDRGNPAVAGAIDGLDPAVLRLVDRCCRGAAAHGRPVGLCGGLASDPLAVPVLIGLGVSELSCAPAMVAEIKAVVRAVSLEQCRALADRVLQAATAAEVRALAGALLKELEP